MLSSKGNLESCNVVAFQRILLQEREVCHAYSSLGVGEKIKTLFRLERRLGYVYICTNIHNMSQRTGSHITQLNLEISLLILLHAQSSNRVCLGTSNVVPKLAWRWHDKKRQRFQDTNILTCSQRVYLCVCVCVWVKCESDILAQSNLNYVRRKARYRYPNKYVFLSP